MSKAVCINRESRSKERWRKREVKEKIEKKRDVAKEVHVMLRICSEGVTLQHRTDNRVNTLCTGLEAQGCI